MFLADNIIIGIIKNLDEIDRIAFILTCKKFWRLRAHLTFYSFTNKTITIRQLRELHKLHGADNITEEILFNCVQQHLLEQEQLLAPPPPPPPSLKSTSNKKRNSKDTTTTTTTTTTPVTKFHLKSFQDNYFKSIYYILVIDDEINQDIQNENGGVDNPIQFGLILKELLDIPAANRILKILYNNSKYAIPSTGWISSNIVSVALGKSYDLPITPNSIPITVTSFSFGHNYNQPLLYGSLPSGLYYLDTGSRFNHPISKGILPDKLRLLLLGEEFDQDIDISDLPHSCVYLQLGKSFNRPLLRNDPLSHSSLENIIFGLDYNQEIQPGVVPLSTKTIHFFNPLERPFFNTNWLPTSLTKIIASRINFPLETGIFSYLTSLKSLTIELYYHGIAPGSLPPNLKKLKFEQRFNHPLEPGALPNSLISLSLGNYYNSPLNGALPKGLKKLVLGYQFNLPIAQGELPDSLTHLAFGDKYDQPLYQYHISPILETLILGHHYPSDQIESIILPNTLTTLELFQFPFSKLELNSIALSNSNINHSKKNKIKRNKNEDILTSNGSTTTDSNTTTTKKIKDKLFNIFKKKKKTKSVITPDEAIIHPEPQPTTTENENDVITTTETSTTKINDHPIDLSNEVKEGVEKVDNIQDKDPNNNNNNIIQQEQPRFRLPKSLKHFTTSTESNPLLFNHLPNSVETLIFTFFSPKIDSRKSKFKDSQLRLPSIIPANIKTLELHITTSHQPHIKPYVPISALSNLESLILRNPFTKVLKCRKTGKNHLFVLSSDIEDKNNGFISIKDHPNQNILEDFQFYDESWLHH